MKPEHDDDGDKGPLMGALLRRCHQKILSRIEQGFAEAGFLPLQPGATQPLWDNPAGMRLTDLAAHARMTKQSMGELVDQMVAVGYVERIADASDGRARLLRLTAKGRKAGRLARALIRQTEASWAARLGSRRVRALKQTLAAIDALQTETSAA